MSKRSDLIEKLEDASEMIAKLAVEHGWTICDEAAGAIRELEAEGAELRGVLLGHGFTPCDIPACNCGSWHQTGGFKARFYEIEDATNDDWRNGETLLARIQRIVEERDRLREALEAMYRAYKGCYDMALSTRPLQSDEAKQAETLARVALEGE
jgi:hypothetical protein